MLRGQKRREIVEDITDTSATALGRTASAVQEVLTALRAYTRLIEFLVVISIIAVVAALLWPSLLQARHAAYVTTCLAKLNQLGQAMEMYHMDYGAYPRAEGWHEALRGHLGSFEDENGGDEALRGRLGSFEDEKVNPFKCAADTTSDLSSYCYLDLSLLPRAQRRRSPTDLPMLVDELHHPFKATVLWYDQHQTVVDKLDWLEMRRDNYRIRRDLAHPEWLCFVPIPSK